ncbi:MAG: thiamine/thiamine pyrophosphate ABC transporter permease ThiP [Limimaricola sp.]|uniref:thiamine/thiamine pyrophosphate ABC transporter permease ThiP n=1 Tax=Limimaricola sp. TaxID=2211665 RepID=UPI001DAC0472|nr:thiamine/thiamine pyrophosphate ABC transporter permease ThiP [Limimaricola sp.]MBI1417091.1 thiamine/thiamine pyrophosphate ABC transporter permease ThiP [Limimaricola sp.]
MAHRAVALGPLRWTGTAAAVLVVALVLGTLAAVASRAGSGAALASADVAAVLFTLQQAAVSAVLSVALAVPVARALARRRFAGRRALVALMGAPFILPVIVAVFGLLAIFGRGGLLNAGLGALGLGPVSVYGFGGVVLANVFFNLPLATRLILQGWSAIPAERFRLAATLNAPVGRLLERPMLRDVLPGAALAIFLICLASFAVALILGGGPRATTVEVAIFQALRFDFDPAKAALLALVQVALCTVAAGLAGLVTVPAAFGPGLDRVPARWDGRGRGARLADGAAIALAAAFLLAPLAMVVAQGFVGLGQLPLQVWPAALRSLAVALSASVLAVGLALAMALRGGALVQVAGVLPLASSALVMGTGLFVLSHGWLDPGHIALPATALVNAAASLPFAFRALAPAVGRIEAAHGPLADTLGLTGWPRLRWLYLPRLRGELGFAAGLSAALSVGDLGVITLFAGPDSATLPLVMYRLMGSYRLQAAAGVALMLLAMALAVFWAFDRGGRGHAAA